MDVFFQLFNYSIEEYKLDKKYEFNYENKISSNFW
jgi:hypothetical protein